MKTNPKITALFEAIIGQEKAKENVRLSLTALEAGKPATNKMLRGESGLGKTRMMDAIGESYAEMGWNVERVNCPSEIVGERYASICETVRESLAPTVFLIDEAHRLAKGRVSVERFRHFVQLATDERMIGKEISINDGELSVGCLSRHSLAFVLATNFASKLEEGKGSTSFQGRFANILLESYSRDEVSAILALMIKAKGLNVAESTRGYIAGCARGNARPLQMITDKLETISANLDGKTTLNREHVMTAIRLSDMFPGGLDKTEIDILNRLAVRSTRKNVLATMFPNVDSQAFGNSLAYLQSKDFAVMGSGGFTLTPLGGRYLKETAKLGFDVAPAAE